MPEKLFKVHKEEYMLPGNRACSGCGLSLAYSYVLKALRESREQSLRNGEDLKE